MLTHGIREFFFEICKVMRTEFIGAILLYAISLFSIFKGFIYKYLGWKYTTQVKAQLVGDLIFSNPLGLISSFISWKLTAVFCALLGTYFLYLGLTTEEQQEIK